MEIASGIEECLDVAMCLVQLTTPKYITLEPFTVFQCLSYDMPIQNMHV